MNAKNTPVMPMRRKAALIGFGALALIVLACTCGPLTQLQQARDTAGTAQAFATEINVGLPTLVAGLTEIGPTFEAGLTEIGPTFEAGLTEIGPTFEALQTEAGDLLPTLEAQLTAVEGDPGDGSRQWAVRAVASSQFGDPSWAASQAVGAPDTPECGDFSTAWASASPTGVDWLRLEYDTPVTPKQIEIYQNYNPGAINQVDVTVQGGGVTHIVYQAPPAPGDECPKVLVIPIQGLDVKVAEVIVYVDQSNHPGWNEIDAVQLIGVP